MKKLFFAPNKLRLAVFAMLFLFIKTFAQEKPNILIIYVDDMAAIAGTYGNNVIITPNIDKFATEAVRFDNAYCQVAICTASRTSILTGVRPSTSGLYGLNHNFKTTLPNNISLPKHFGNNGYRTIAMGKIADKRSGDWSDQWDEFHFGYGINASKATNKLDQLDATNKPWFLAVGFSEPHCPWNPKASTLAQYNINDIEIRGPGRARTSNYQRSCYGIDKAIISDAEARETTLRYFAKITEVDVKIGTVLQKARDLGLYENTIIIVWSGDHGFQLGENNLWGKWKNYRASTRIPLLMHVPNKSTPNTSVNGLIETIDMYQTLSDLAELPNPNTKLDGYSFAPLFKNNNRIWKKAVFSHDISGNKRAVKTAQYNLILSRQGVPLELYDMTADPRETTNLVSSKPNIVAQMKQLYSNGWENALPALTLTANTTKIVEELSNITVFPNPGTNSLFIKGQKHVTYNIKILDVQGKEHLNISIEATGNDEIDIADLSTGTYVVQIQGGNTINSVTFIKK